MTDTAQQAWKRWWCQKGSGMRPLPTEETEEFVERITKIAWRTSAYARLGEIERLRAELAAVTKERDALIAERNREGRVIIHGRGDAAHDKRGI